MLALSMFAVSSWSFQNGFLNYVNQSELQRFDNLVEELETKYKEEDNWNWLVDNKHLWRKLIRENDRQNNKNVDEKRNPRFEEQGLFSGLSRPFDRAGPDRKRLRPPPRGREHLVLLDKNKKIIVGKSYQLNNILMRPISSEGEPVAYLGINKKNQLSSELDQIFANQQRLSYALIAIGSIFISLIVAFPFASKLIQPIKALLDGTKNLAEGEYSSRVTIESRDEIGELSLAFNDMADSIEKGRMHQRQWVADISHELRTPLAVLKAEIEAMQDGIRDTSTKSLHSLHQEASHLGRLVDDLHELSLSDMDSLKLVKDDVSIKQLVEEIAGLFDHELKEKGLKLNIHTDGDSAIRADSDRLLQLFTNLIQNNLRYNQKGDEILINVINQSIDNNLFVKIVWEDSGAGVDRKNLNKLFERLYREDSSRTKRTGGSGLGLSIAKSIVEAHGGNINAYQAELGGLGIEILIPR